MKDFCGGIDYCMCVFCWNLMKDFCGGIDYCMCVFCWNLMKDFVLELIIASVYSAGI
jgi:hypothetical protein